MKDVREHELKPMTLRIGIEMTVYALGDPKGFLGNTSDEIAQLMTQRFETASVVTHVKTTEWDFSLSGGDATSTKEEPSKE